MHQEAHQLLVASSSASSSSSTACCRLPGAADAPRRAGRWRTAVAECRLREARVEGRLQAMHACRGSIRVLLGQGQRGRRRHVGDRRPGRRSHRRVRSRVARPGALFRGDGDTRASAPAARATRRHSRRAARHRSPRPCRRELRSSISASARADADARGAHANVAVASRSAATAGGACATEASAKNAPLPWAHFWQPALGAALSLDVR